MARYVIKLEPPASTPVERSEKTTPQSDRYLTRK